MAGAFTLHKMRPSERCDECPTRRWYEVDGNRFCKNGHQLEGFAPHEAGEDEYNSTGRVTKAKREKRKREGLKLEGKEGRRLYLQALQFVLRRQMEWVRDVGLRLQDAQRRLEFERIVKELWAALCAIPGVMDDEVTDQGGSGTEGEIIASGSEPDDSDAYGVKKRQGWLEKSGSKLPNHTHTLALCYLACIVLRYPVTTADFRNWAQQGSLEYLAAIHSLPLNVQNRLPAMYHRALQVRDHIKPGKLLYTAQELVLALGVQYEGFRFPALNYTQVLLHYVLSLTLPVEVYLMVKCLVKIVEATFEFPCTKSRRIRAIDNPEVILITLVVVATKLLYPMDGVDRPRASEDDPRIKQIDWLEWEKGRVNMHTNKSTPDRLQRGTEYQVTSNEAISMEENKMDDFMDWFEKMWVGSNDAEVAAPAAIRREFDCTSSNDDQVSRQEMNLSSDVVGGNTTVAIQRQYQILNDTAKFLQSHSDSQPVNDNSKGQSAWDFCPTWRSEDELPTTAKTFYQEAADLAAISLKSLVVAGLQVERRLEVWSAKQEKEKRRMGQVNADAKGKGRAVV